MIKLWLCLAGLMFWTLPATGQAYSYLIEKYENGATMSLQKDAWLIRHPTIDLRIVGKLKAGKEVFVYRQIDDFYAVATQEAGHAGFVLGHTLGLSPEDPLKHDWVPVAPPKSITEARILSFAFPGAGYIYAEEFERGVTIALLGVGSLVGGLLISEQSKDFVCAGISSRDFDLLTYVGPSDQCRFEYNRTPLKIGALLYTGFLGIGVWKAGAAVRRHRARNPVLPIVSPEIGARHVGVTLSLSLENPTR